jgi:hypothetical protein
MTVILKRAGSGPEMIETKATIKSLRELLGGEYESIPALAGAMVLCREKDAELPDNCHFLGRHYKGDILIVGRGKNDCATDIPKHLVKILPLALGGGKK